MNVKVILSVSRPLLVGLCMGALGSCAASKDGPDTTSEGAPLGAGAPVFGDDAEEGSAAHELAEREKARVQAFLEIAENASS